MYDLLLKCGTVIEPSHSLNEKLDVGITGDRITGLAAAIEGSETTGVIDVSGKLVTPGRVDNHVLFTLQSQIASTRTSPVF